MRNGRTDSRLATSAAQAAPGAVTAAVDVVPGREGGLGTFGGVFTPSILTILGVIMYLRLGWVVGNVGVGGTFLIVTISTSITFLTALSISEIASDQRVRVGGAYYMISRSLGIESGGAVGIPLYFAQALSVALYTVGFAESLVSVFPALDERWTGIVTTVLVAGLAFKSARAAIKVQYFIMAAIGVSLVSLLFGHPVEPAQVGLLPPEAVPRADFWVVFAVFFPAVTGIMAGVNLSGDLEDPGRSIPKGTLLAVGVGYLIYMTIPLLIVGRASPEALIADPMIMRRMAFWGDAILLGVWGATLSSAVGSILGAPRVLQALSQDGVLPHWLRWLGKGSGPGDEPRWGTAMTLGVALVAVWFGNLNLIAPVLTMFFLTTYGVLNIAAGVERFLESPAFRPKLRVHWSLSALGALGCVAVMFLVNAVATIVAGAIVLGIFLWLERRELQTAWGDVRRGIWMAITSAGLLRLRRGTADAKNWRPHLLVLSGAPTKRWHLIDLASAISHNRALMTVSSVLPEDQFSPERQMTMEGTLREYLERRGVRALLRIVRAPDPYQGAVRLVEAYGLGALAPNTVLLGTNEGGDENRQRYAEMVAHIHRVQRNVVIVRHDPQKGFGRRRRIDVWWGGLKKNGGLMMTLAYLLSTSQTWRGAELNIKMIVPTDAAAEGARANLETLLGDLRTKGHIHAIVSEGRSFQEIVHESSRYADLVVLGMRQPKEDVEEYGEYLAHLMERTKELPSTIFTLASENLEFADIWT